MVFPYPIRRELRDLIILILARKTFMYGPYRGLGWGGIYLFRKSENIHIHIAITCAFFSALDRI